MPIKRGLKPSVGGGLFIVYVVYAVYAGDRLRPICNGQLSMSETAFSIRQLLWSWGNLTVRSRSQWGGVGGPGGLHEGGVAHRHDRRSWRLSVRLVRVLNASVR